MRAPRKPRPPAPLPHKRRSRIPVIGPAIMAYIASHPGVNPPQVHAALGGSLATIQTLMSNAKMRGELFANGLKLRRVYYATQAEADIGALIPRERQAHTLGPVKAKLLAVLESMPGGASPVQLIDATGLKRSQLFDALGRMTKAGQIAAVVHKQRHTYFISVALCEEARPGIEAAWVERVKAARAAAAPAHRIQATAHYHRKRALLPPKIVKVAAPKPVKVAKVKPPKVAKVKAIKPPKPARVPAVPKPKPPAALVFVKTPTRKGWGINDPAHITADTIVTIYKTPVREHFRTNTHFQY